MQAVTGRRQVSEGSAERSEACFTSDERQAQKKPPLRRTYTISCNGSPAALVRRASQGECASQRERHPKASALTSGSRCHQRKRGSPAEVVFATGSVAHALEAGLTSGSVTHQWKRKGDGSLARSSPCQEQPLLQPALHGATLARSSPCTEQPC